MSDNAISTGIMSTASIITTVVIISAALTVAIAIGASINNSGQNLADQINTDFEVITMGEIEPGNSTIYSYLKCTGTKSIGDFSLIDIFLDGEYYALDSVDSAIFRWNATILNDNGNNIWDIHETILIRLYYPDGQSISAGSHTLTISIRGNSENFLFSI